MSNKKNLLDVAKKLKKIRISDEQWSQLKPIGVRAKSTTASGYLFETSLEGPGDSVSIPKAEHTEDDFKRLKRGLRRYAKIHGNVKLEFREDNDNWYVRRTS